MQETDDSKIRDIERLIDILPSDVPVLTEVKPGTKKCTQTGWNNPENLLTPDQARQHIKSGGNVGIRLGLNNRDEVNFVVLDVEEEGSLPHDVAELIKEHTLAVWESPHGGLNRLLTVTLSAYDLMEPFHQQKLDLDGDGDHELELLTKLHAIIPPSEIDHQECNDGKDGCPGVGRDTYRWVNIDPEAATMTEDLVHELLGRLGLDREEAQKAARGGPDNYDLPIVDEGLADVGEAVLRTLQKENTPAFDSLIDLLQGGTGGYDDLLFDNSSIDRSHQELMALTRLHEVIVYLGDEEGERAAAITRSTFERYVRKHQITNDGQVRKWLERGNDNYREERLGRALAACDRGKFNRFLNRDPRDEDGWQSWTGEYSSVTYSKVRFVLDLLTGKLNPFFETVEDLCDTVATFYDHDPNEETLRDLLDNPPASVHGTTPNPGCVSAEDYPSPSTVVEVTQQLDERDNDITSYEEALRRLRRDGLLKLARMGRQYVVYPAHLPDPDACYVKCGGKKKYEPQENPKKRERNRPDAL